MTHNLYIFIGSNVVFHLHIRLSLCQLSFNDHFENKTEMLTIEINPFLLFFLSGGPLGLFIIFPEPVPGPPLATSNCDFKGRPFFRTANFSRIHV